MVGTGVAVGWEVAVEVGVSDENGVFVGETSCVVCTGVGDETVLQPEMRMNTKIMVIASNDFWIFIPPPFKLDLKLLSKAVEMGSCEN